MVRIRPLLALVCVAIVFASGCTAIVSNGDSGDADAGAIVENVDSTLEDTETLEATLVATVEVGNETITERTRLRYERPQAYNLTYLEVTNASGDTLTNATGDIVVSNGTQLWGYDDATDRLLWLNATTPRNLTELLMPSTQFGQDVTFAGNTTVAGQDAIALSYSLDGSQVSLISGEVEKRSRLAGRMNDSTPVNATVWIDRDRWLPVKTRLRVTAFEENVTTTYRYEDIRRNVEIPEGSFDPPQSASRGTPWAELEDTLGEHQSIADVRTETSIVEPSVPQAFTFEWGNVTTVNGTEVTILFYRKDTAILQVNRWDNTSVDPLKQGESVAVGSTTGTLVTLSKSRLVEWSCDGHTYLVSTRASRDVALETARSIGCG